jgi:hypothetical protein
VQKVSRQAGALLPENSPRLRGKRLKRKKVKKDLAGGEFFCFLSCVGGNEARDKSRKKMTIKNAIKKLERNGFKVSNKEDRFFFAEKENSSDVIEFFKNGGTQNVICINVRSRDDHHDSMSDYSAGVFVRNISQAIAIAN